MTVVTAPRATCNQPAKDDAQNPTRRNPPTWDEIREDIPDPGSTSGAYFHYTPAEASQWLPFSKEKLRKMAFAREVEHVNNGNRIWFSGLNIRAITEQFTIPPFAKHAAA
ncbi:hypothetical protein ACWD25_54740 [Streptomyces sp. NPDC002920]